MDDDLEKAIIAHQAESEIESRFERWLGNDIGPSYQAFKVEEKKLREAMTRAWASSEPFDPFYIEAVTFVSRHFARVTEMRMHWNKIRTRFLMLDPTPMTIPVGGPYR